MYKHFFIREVHYFQWNLFTYSTDSRSTFEFPSRVNLSGLMVCTVPPGRGQQSWSSSVYRTSWCNEVDAVRLYTSIGWIYFYYSDRSARFCSLYDLTKVIIVMVFACLIKCLKYTYWSIVKTAQNNHETNLSQLEMGAFGFLLRLFIVCEQPILLIFFNC